jgi:hypothetical protein
MSEKAVQVNTMEQGLIDSGLQITDAKQLLEAYGMPLVRVGELLSQYQNIVVTDVNDQATMQRAREMRLELKGYRVDIKKKHDALKADVLKQAQAIDFVERTARNFIAPAEEYLEKQENFAKHLAAERAQKKLAERKAALLKWTDNIAPYEAGLLALSDEDFEQLEYDLQRAKENADAAAKLAEAERQKELEKARAEKAEADARAAKAEAAAKAERDKAAALQAEKDAAAAKVAKEEADKLAAAKAAAAAPDKEQMLKAIDAVELPTPALKTDAAMELHDKIATHLAKTLDMYRKQIKEGL